jgi:LacI family transcriptional regulator
MADNSSPDKVTISDIARESGVSPAAVSLALRNKPGVSDTTRQQILQNAQAMGYPVETNGASPKTAVSSLGLIIKTRPNDAPSTNYFYAPVLAGIEAFCRRWEINLFYANLPVDEENNPLAPPRLLKQQYADGLLFVGAYLNQATINILHQQHVPVVLVDAYASKDQYDAVISDNKAGAYQAAKHLIQQGHRQIAIVGSSPQAYPSILARRAGFLQAIEDHGLQPTFVDCHHHPDEAAPVAAEFLRQTRGVTAVFGVNDEVAIAVIRAAQKMGKQVPQDLSVIGFDNISLAQHITPALTTMRIDKMGMGRLAAQLLLNRIENPEMGQTTTIIRPNLIERQSVSTLL